MSTASQNELIDISAKLIIKKLSIEEIKEVKYRSISVREVTSSNDELLLICVHCADKNKKIREVVLEFMYLERYIKISRTNVTMGPLTCSPFKKVMLATF